MTRQAIIQQIFERGREVFFNQVLQTKQQRLAALNRLEEELRASEKRLLKALKLDLNKSVHEAFMTEIGLIYGELSHAKKHLGRWMKPQRVGISLGQMPGRVRLHSDPYGCVLIMSPWNYPALLTINPLISALSAGNTVVLKPSAYSPHTSTVLEQIIRQAFPDDLVQIVTGGREENQALLDIPFDYIFFTGSPKVGRFVMEKAAQHLTPITLELGGKSPVIVDQTADIEQTAKRLLFGKLLNAGQTCIAPDHVFVHRYVKQKLIDALIKQSQLIFKDPTYVEDNWPRIISEKHFKRLKGLIEQNRVVYGGGSCTERQTIEFTIVDSPPLDSPVMQEEIFGPILPILVYDDLNQLIREQQQRPKPLALYLFTKDNRTEQRVLKELSFGGGCINDTVLHISSTKAPFGGVGNSGMGHYHGKYGFQTFSHQKTILKKSWFFDVSVRHHPYKSPDTKLPKWMLK
ncbi:MAG: aldehyde dehydrogenase [Fastidiosipilaceae bacterium]|jgi:aldehyde dehydrogenase (NAD+)|nr:aldehyde dehydrogenase [Clostridiaceae bacterium]